MAVVSSCRECWVKSRNERNPVFSYQRVMPGTLETAQENGEEGGDDVKSAWPLCLGLHTCYNGRHKALQTRRGANRKKPASVQIEVCNSTS